MVNGAAGTVRISILGTLSSIATPKTTGTQESRRLRVFIGRRVEAREQLFMIKKKGGGAYE